MQKHSDNLKVYRLEFIPGTEFWVEREIRKKHPKTAIKKFSKTLFSLISQESIDVYKDVLSGIRITAIDKAEELNLYRREWRKEYVPAGINPALAFVMCTIAELSSDDVILDPFCGGGTIPITAATFFNPKQVIASDISGKAIDITERNIERANLKKVMVFRSDIVRLKLGVASISKIVTNLPFGIRERSHLQNEKIYQAFAKTCLRILIPQAKIIVLTQEINLLRGAFGDYKFVKLNEYPIEQGGLKPHIFVFKLQ